MAVTQRAPTLTRQVKDFFATSLKRSFYGVLGLVAFFTLMGSYFTVSSGTKALVFRFGDAYAVVGEGLHFKIPWLDSVQHVNIRTQKADAKAAAGTKDLQFVSTEVSVNYHLNGNLLPDTYKRFGLNVEETIVDPRIQEVVKAVVAKFSAEELLSQRDIVKSQIDAELAKSLLSYNIILEGTQITTFEFSKAYDAAIESKQVEAQNTLKANIQLQHAEIDAKRTVVQAQAKADAIKIQAAAIQAQGGAEYVQLQAIEKWDGKLPATMAGGTVPLVNLK